MAKRPFVLCVLCLLVLVGCSSTRPASPTSESFNLSASNSPSPHGRLDTGNLADSIPPSKNSNDQERLSLLWQERQRATSLSDYPLGPGDILKVSVSDLKEIQQEQVRISGEGTIELPLIGAIPASGLTEKALKKEIRRLLQVDYMHNPQVSLFVVEHHNRQVAVVGAVEEPGLYDLKSEANTILDMVSLAGGMTDKAAPRLLFIPAEPVNSAEFQQLASTLPTQLASTASSTPLLKKTDPITIDLRNLTRGGNQLYMTLPARPGDVIMVPGSGDVLVDGWVTRPGVYAISPGMTVVGAIAAAGGSLFPADTSAVKLIRTQKTGQRTFIKINIDRVTNGEQDDVPIQEGDIVQVAASNAKVVPYGLFRAASELVNFGFYAPIGGRR